MKKAVREADKVSDSLLASYPGGLCGKYINIGIAKQAMHDEAGARELFLKAKTFAEDEIKQNPDYADARGRLAETLAWLGEKDAALAEAKRAQELFPSRLSGIAQKIRCESLADNSYPLDAFPRR